jgi:hypothetical protein
MDKYFLLLFVWAKSPPLNPNFNFSFALPIATRAEKLKFRAFSGHPPTPLFPLLFIL